MSILFLVLIKIGYSQHYDDAHQKHAEFSYIGIESSIPDLNLSIRYLPAEHTSRFPPVLFVHGASFPSGLAFGFRMEGYSWMDYLAKKGFDVYALDFLGYGNADRYPEMLGGEGGRVLGEGREVVKDLHLVVDHILQSTSSKRLYLVGHSRGAMLSGYYASIYPNNIAKLVLFAPFVERKGPTSWQGPSKGYMEMNPVQRIEQFGNGIPRNQPSPLEKEVVTYWGDAWLASDPTSSKRGSLTVRYPSGWRKDLYECWNGNCLFKPQKLISPTLIIRGEWDEAFNCKDLSQLIGNMKNVRHKKIVRLKRSTHVAHLEESRDLLYRKTYKFFINSKFH